MQEYKNLLVLLIIYYVLVNVRTWHEEPVNISYLFIHILTYLLSILGAAEKFVSTKLYM